MAGMLAAIPAVMGLGSAVTSGPLSTGLGAASALGGLASGLTSADLAPGVGGAAGGTVSPGTSGIPGTLGLGGMRNTENWLDKAQKLMELGGSAGTAFQDMMGGGGAPMPQQGAVPLSAPARSAMIGPSTSPPPSAVNAAQMLRMKIASDPKMRRALGLGSF